MIRKIDDFLIDQVFQKIADGIQVRFDWTCFQIAASMLKCAGIIAMVLGAYVLIESLAFFGVLFFCIRECSVV